MDTLKDYKSRNGGRIVSATLRLGRLGGVDPEALRFAWPLALEAAGEDPAGCALLIELLPLRLQCRACGAETETEKPIGQCAMCGSESLTRLNGRELVLQQIEVEQDV